MGDKEAYKSNIQRYNLNESENKFTDSIFENLVTNKTVDENWLTTKKAAAFLGITPNALRIRVHRGQVVASKLGAHLRFSMACLKILLIKKEY
jgi:hypothetical protein